MNRPFFAKMAAVLVSFMMVASLSGDLSNAQQDSSSPAPRPKKVEAEHGQTQGKGYKFKYLGESDIMGAGEIAGLFGRASDANYKNKIVVSAEGTLVWHRHPLRRFSVPVITVELSVNGKAGSAKKWNDTLPRSSGAIGADGSIVFDSETLNEDDFAKNLVGQILEAVASAPPKESVVAASQVGNDATGPYTVEIERSKGLDSVVVTENRRYQPSSPKFIRPLKPTNRPASRGTVKWVAKYLGTGFQPYSVSRTSNLKHYINKRLVGQEQRTITLDADSTVNTQVKNVKPDSGSRQASREEQRKKAADMGQAILAKLEGLSENTAKEEVTDTYLKLKDHLAKNSDYAELLAPYLTAYDPESLSFRMSLLALATVGSPEAQRVIAAAMKERLAEWPAFQQLSMSLAHVDSPEPAAAESLWQAYQNAPDKHSANHGLYAYGSILRGLQSTDPSSPLLVRGYERIKDTLTQGEGLVSGLIALGNYGYKSQEEALLRHLSSPNSRVRAEATSALRFVPTLSTERKIVQMLEDPSEEVRLEAARALEHRMIGNESAKFLTSILVSEDSILVLKAILKALLVNRENNAYIDAALEKYMKSDIPPEIYKFLVKNN